LIYSFGGTETTKNGTVVLSKSVFVFDCMKLSWEEKPQLCYTLRGAAPVVGNDGRTIYLFGGISTEVDMLSN
jgi:N-acetylneuraminic acid mutarotase